MMPLLLELTLRGSLVTVIVLVLDWALTRLMRPTWRRIWWILVHLAWLVPLRLPRVPAELRLPLPAIATAEKKPGSSTMTWASSTGAPALAGGSPWANFIGVLLAAGSLTALVAIATRTARTAHRWSGERLCTDSILLNLLEDCKFDAGITAPIGLIVTSSVYTPVLLGWLRPRILLPKTLVDSVSPKELRSILLHELSHFHSFDIPVNWFFGVVLAIHWFNPLAHLAFRRWRHYCEVAADASVLEWSRADAGEDYGHALIKAVSHAREIRVPQGAFALGESFEDIRERIKLVLSGRRRPRMAMAAMAVASGLVLFLALPSQAGTAIPEDSIEATSTASRVSSEWLKLLDGGKNDESWMHLSADFKKVFNLEQWKRLNDGRESWGRCVGRKFMQSDYSTRVDLSSEGPVLREWVTFRYDTFFKKLGHRWETITATREADGHWRIGGYVLTPR